MDASRTSRRSFLATGATATAGLMVHSSTPAAEDTRLLKLGIVGCGGRGTGALDDSFTANNYVKLVAAADPFPAKAAALRTTLAEKHADKMALDDARIYGGIDGYKRVLADPEVDIVLLTSPPGFRPRMILEAVQAGKHVFAEKPVCVDPAGYRICQAAQAAAEAAGTAIVTGTQYRRQANYIGAVEQIRQGAIGDIVGGSTRYCSTGIWYRPRKEGMSDTEYQVNNWMHFIWLSGDQIAEQAVHNIDTINWVMGANPVSAYGSGGRFTRPDDSEMWDSMSIEYEYPGDRTISFMCRQIPGTTGDNGSVIHGTEATCFIGAINSGSRIVNRKGEEIWSQEGSISDAYKQEHADLVASIRAGKPIVEVAQTADSSLTAVLGRVAAYTGQRVTFEFLANESKLDLFPPELEWAGSLPEPKHAIPGRTKLV
ncbi:MAG: Inositol 2-dehydrogenase/D-chiro-inositol 3-dehydrogenase [Planctomycetota bacterium]